MNTRAYKYGIELECYIDSTDQGSFVTDIQGLPIEVGTDGSIAVENGGIDRGMELRTTGEGLTYTKLESCIQKLGIIADSRDIRVNKSCGYHVHMSNPKFFSPVYVKKIIAFWIAIEDVLIATQPRSRFDNQYCQRQLRRVITDGWTKLPKQKNQLIDTLSGHGKYYTLNLSSLSLHGTIECRLHAGTVNSAKILNWVKLLTCFYDYIFDKYNSEEVKNLFEMSISDEKIDRTLRLLGLEENLISFYKLRVHKFSFDRLSKQQQLAKEAMKIIPERQKAREAYNKSSLKLNTLEQQVNRILDNF